MNKKYMWRIILVVSFFIGLMFASALIERDNNAGYIVLFIALIFAYFCSNKLANEEDKEVANRINKH